MRKIGEFTSTDHARRFHRYLAAQGIENRLEELNRIWSLWVLDEDQVAPARDVLEEFQAAPDSARFDAPPVAIEPRHPPQVAPAPAVRRRGSERPGTTTALIVISVAVAILTDFGASNRELLGTLSLSNFLRTSGDLLPVEVLRGEVWRLWTPMFIHLSLMHLLFNMYWLWVMGGQIERVRGRWELLRVVLFSGLLSHLGEFCVQGPAFGGMSGVIYGLLGFLWARSRLLPEENLWIPPEVVTLLVGWMLLGFTHLLDDVLGPMANWAHLFGLLGGVILGALPRLWRTA